MTPSGGFKSAIGQGGCAANDDEDEGAGCWYLKKPGYTPHLGHESGELVGENLEYGEAGRAKPVYTPQPGHLGGELVGEFEYGEAGREGFQFSSGAPWLFQDKPGYTPHPGHIGGELV
eukprot:8701919-Karenia_brevis.AAC.1